MAKQIQLAKTCVACGLQKPISAFLQISGPQGNSYGNVCSACRGSTTNKAIVIEKTEDERSGSSSGLKIDSKTKLQIERDQKELAEKKQTLDKDTLETQIENADDKSERKENRAEAERKHRENYIEPKKSDSFFGKKVDAKSPLTRLITEKQNQDRRVTEEHQTKIENLHAEQSVKQEMKDKGLDLSDLATDQLIGGKIKMQRLNQLKSWFGNAPMNTVERQFNASQSDKAKVEHTSGNKDVLIETAKENWEPTSPGSKRR